MRVDVVVPGASGRPATLPQQTGIVDLLNGANLRIPGVPGLDIQSGASAGDVNGDGLNDIILGAPGKRMETGRRPVPCSSSTADGRRGTVDLNALGTGGFRVNGAAAGDFFGESVASLGDMTGDGLAEVAVTAPFASPQGRTAAGAAYVIFGAPSSGGFPLSQISAYGFEIDGPIAHDLTGPVAGGDVNGDGRADVVVRAGISTYVVFGRPRGANETIDLAGLGSAGFRIDGDTGAVATGDVNGDGRADVIVGDATAANGTRLGLRLCRLRQDFHSDRLPGCARCGRIQDRRRRQGRLLRRFGRGGRRHDRRWTRRGRRGRAVREPARQDRGRLGVRDLRRRVLGRVSVVADRRLRVRDRRRRCRRLAWQRRVGCG